MNCNFYWQPDSISLIPTNPTCLYFDQSRIKTSNHIDFEFELKQIKRKCKELELENSQLKEEISILEVPFISIYFRKWNREKAKESSKEEKRNSWIKNSNAQISTAKKSMPQPWLLTFTWEPNILMMKSERIHRKRAKSAMSKTP